MKRIQYILLAAILFTCYAHKVNAQRVTLSYTIDPVETLKDMSDIKITPSGGTASSFQANEGIEKSFDGNMSTLYHSSYNSTTFPVTLQYNFASTDQIDYFVYHPRSSGNNGNFKEIEVYYKLQGAGEVKYKDLNFAGSGTPSIVKFDNPLINPEYIKIVVNSGAGDGNGFASCAEMEFYELNKSLLNLSEYFVDNVFSGVKPGVSKEQILASSDIPLFFKYLALEQLEGNYSPVRIQSHEAYRPYGELAEELKTSTYNQYENPTGIFVESGKSIVVFVPDTKGENISLSCRNWNDDNQVRSYVLKEGINFITPAISGNTYINYYTANYKTAAPVKVHIYGGKVNGIFVKGKHTNEDWKNLLANATSEYLDIVGEYVNLTYYVSELKKTCPSDGVRLIELYDEIIELQYQLMGFFKYDRVPKNHMFGRNTLTGFMSAGGVGANFQYETLSTIGNPSNIVKGGNSWGIAHEFGHVNQIRPGLKWVGMAECTNNVYSSYTQYIFQKKYSTMDLRLEHEDCRTIEGEASVIGGRFNSHLHYGVLKGDNWIFQWGQDGPSDHFVKLVPLWQLNMYFKVAEGTDWRKPDWYGDICEEVIKQNDSGLSNGNHQINFMKRACKVTQTDLTEFFEKAGILKPIDETIDDYGIGTLKITEAMCQDVKDYVALNGWGKPAGVINYISGNTIEVYEKKLPVEGTLNEGVSGTGTYRVVDHNIWKNAVVYKTYKGDEVVRLTMAGTGTKDNSSTRVPYPEDSTKIVAVSWDGKETIVFQ